MGLGIACGDVYERVGSYSMVQPLRAELLKAVLAYLKSEKAKDITGRDYTKVIEYVESILKPDTTFCMSSYLDYRKFSMGGNDLLRQFGVYGVIPFVCHSDCEGFLEWYECEGFLDTWARIREYVSAAENILNEDGEFYLAQVFEESVRTKQPLVFC